MQRGFDTDELIYAEAATLLYAMFRSREKNSPLSGVETWSRCQSFIRAAVIKSGTLPAFIQNFCQKAGVQSIKPMYLDDGGLVKVGDEFVEMEGIHDYHTKIFEKEEILDCFAKESMYIILLVRERLQRERLGMSDEG